MARNPIRMAMGLFGRAASSAASAGRSIWGTLTSTARVFQREGIITSLPPADAITTVLSWANSKQAAMDAFAAASPESPITGDMVAARYAVSNMEPFYTNPTYSMFVEYKVTGDTSIYGLTISGIDPFGKTKADLMAVAEANAIGVATDTGPQAGQQATLDQITGVHLIANTVSAA